MEVDDVRDEITSHSINKTREKKIVAILFVSEILAEN